MYEILRRSAWESGGKEGRGAVESSVCSLYVVVRTGGEQEGWRVKSINLNRVGLFCLEGIFVYESSDLFTVFSFPNCSQCSVFRTFHGFSTHVKARRDSCRVARMMLTTSTHGGTFSKQV